MCACYSLTAYRLEPFISTYQALDDFHASATAAGVPFTASPTLVHHDTQGQFGPAGESEWMAFLKDPAGNTIGLVERHPPQEQ